MSNLYQLIIKVSDSHAFGEDDDRVLMADLTVKERDAILAALKIADSVLDLVEALKEDAP